MNEVDAYISSFPPDVQEKLTAMRDLIRETVPQAAERICMSMPTYDLNGSWLVHFAGFKKHIGFYPQPEGVSLFLAKLSEYKTTKGGVQFPLNKPLPLDLIREIIEFRLSQQNMAKPKEVKLEEDKSRAITIPDELTSALKEETEANAFFESLSDGYKREYCDWVGGAKQESTRKTRAEKALIMLKNKQKTLKT